MSDAKTDSKSGTAASTGKTTKSNPNAHHTPLQRAMSLLALLAGVVLLVSVSWEIITGDHEHFSRWYLALQLVICIVFLLDFFVRMATAPCKGRFFVRNFFFLLLAVPYLNIVHWCHADLTRDWAMLISLTPLLRTFLALYVVLYWMVNNRFKLLFWAYIITVVVFTYLSALIFFDYEVLVNDKLHGFGNALWWAWMNVTTVGAEIFAVTTIGKVVTVLLPSLGMMMFPIFTVYVVQQFTHNKAAGE